MILPPASRLMSISTGFQFCAMAAMLSSLEDGNQEVEYTAAETAINGCPRAADFPPGQEKQHLIACAQWVIKRLGPKPPFSTPAES